MTTINTLNCGSMYPAKKYRESDEVMVGYLTMPEVGMLSCEVLKRDRTNDEPHGVTLVRFAMGKPAKVVYCHSQNRYVFA